MSRKWIFTFKNFQNVYWHGKRHGAIRDIETFPSKQMYIFPSLVERKEAEFYHDIDRTRNLVWLNWLIFIIIWRLLVSMKKNSKMNLSRPHLSSVPFLSYLDSILFFCISWFSWSLVKFISIKIQRIAKNVTQLLQVLKAFKSFKTR